MIYVDRSGVLPPNKLLKEANSEAKRAREFFGNPDHQVSGTLRVLDTVITAARTCATLRARELQNATKYFASIGNSVHWGTVTLTQRGQ